MARRGKKQRKAQLATLLAVGEGPADKAFINHLKDLYSKNTGQRVTVEAEDGGSPATMIRNVIRKHRHADYDRRVLVLDEDVPILEPDIAKARKANIELIISTPVCLEGMLLRVLEQQVPNGATATFCKNQLHPQLSGRETRRESYRELFPKPVIDNTTKEQIVRLRQLMLNGE